MVKFLCSISFHIRRYQLIINSSWCCGLRACKSFEFWFDDCCCWLCGDWCCCLHGAGVVFEESSHFPCGGVVVHNVCVVLGHVLEDYLISRSKQNLLGLTADHNCWWKIQIFLLQPVPNLVQLLIGLHWEVALLDIDDFRVWDYAGLLGDWVVLGWNSDNLIINHVELFEDVGEEVGLAWCAKQLTLVELGEVLGLDESMRFSEVEILAEVVNV